MNKELSAVELYDIYRKRTQTLRLPRTKGLIPANTEVEKSELLKLLNIIKEVLAAEHVQRKNARSDAEWIPDKRLAKITRHTGDIYPHFGYMKSSLIFLSPIEILFLLEMNRLNIYWNGIPFSIEQGYTALLASKIDLNIYKAFQELAYLGYRIPNNEFLNMQTTLHSDLSSKSMKFSRKDSNAEYSKKHNTQKFTDYLNYLRNEGPSTLSLTTDSKYDFAVYISDVTRKNNKPNYQVTHRLDDENMTIQDTCVENSPTLISFAGCESVSFYQLERVNFDNT